MKSRFALAVGVVLVGLSSVATSRVPQRWNVAHPTTQELEVIVLTPEEPFATLSLVVDVPDSARALAEENPGVSLTVSVNAKVDWSLAESGVSSMVQAGLPGARSEHVDRATLYGPRHDEVSATEYWSLDEGTTSCPPRPNPCRATMRVAYGWYGDVQGEIRLLPTVTAEARGATHARKAPELDVSDGLTLRGIRVTHSASPASAKQE